MKDEAIALTGEERVIDQITAILARALQNQPCEAYLFGSRAAGKARGNSDFDVAVLADVDISHELSQAREMLEESNIPFKFDVVELRSTSPAFREAVLKKGVLLWRN